MWDVNRDALAAHHRLVLPDPGRHARSAVCVVVRRLSPIGYADPARALLGMAHVPGLPPGLGLPALLSGGDRAPPLAPMKVRHRRVRGSKLLVLSPASHFGNRD